jgi:DNA replication protein DnaC
MKQAGSLKIKINGKILDFKEVEKQIGSYICSDCGENVKEFESVHIGGEKKGEKFTFTRGCKCEEIEFSKQYYKELQELKLKRERERLNQIFDNLSLINNMLKKCSFLNYDPVTPEQEKALKSCIEYTAQFKLEDPKNLLLSGSYGVGKSHLAVSITKDLLEMGFSCVFVSAPKLLTKIRATYNNDSEIKEDELLQGLEKVDLLVIDDLGAENVNPKTQWTISKLFEVIDGRAGKHTVFTTNFNSADLEKKIGARNFSRVMYNTTPLRIEGEDFRTKEF